MNTLDPEEEELLQSVENEEWKEIENFAGEKQRYAEIARYQIDRMEIERLLSAEDRQKIAELARELDRSVPNVARDILHKYLTGELVERTLGRSP